MVLLAGCTGSAPEPELPPLTVEEISAESLWDRITVESEYTNYGFWPGHEGELPGQSPHGVIHRIYVNRTLLDSLPIRSRVAPDGAIIVKDNLNASRELEGITVMAKVAGYAPESGDWFWASYEPDGTAVTSGAVTGCISCHAGVVSNDYIIVRELDREVPE